jgi:hypothetical protein
VPEIPKTSQLSNSASILEEGLKYLAIEVSDSQLLFRVIHKKSMGSALLRENILPGDTETDPLSDANFDHSFSLMDYGDLDRKGPRSRLSIWISFTSDFLRALSIAIRHKVANYTEITIIVIQKAFTIPGTCKKFNTRMSLAGFPTNFNNIKMSEYLIFGQVPAAAIVSCFIFVTLEDLNYLRFFPQLHTDYKKEKEVTIKKLREQMTSRGHTFSVTNPSTLVFLSALLGYQEAAHTPFRGAGAGEHAGQRYRSL